MIATHHSYMRGSRCCRPVPVSSLARARTKRTGFTLIEMIAVAVIIGILGALVLSALANARASSQATATRATIAKLDALIARQWRSYETRRAPVVAAPNTSGENRQRLRLDALRQLMRMEMPQAWDDVTDGPGDLDNASGPMARPGVSHAYLSYHTAASPSGQFANAECLYMIVTVGLAGQGGDVGSFRTNEIGDLDNDGAPEFHDAWGIPIRFLRWPVGFVNDPVHDSRITDSDERIGSLSDIMPSTINGPGDTCWPDAVEFHDPFDIMRVDEVAFNVYPLIYSAGPDKIFDIYSGGSGGAARSDSPFVENKDGENVLLTEAPKCETYEILGTSSSGSLSGSANPRFAGRPKDLDSFKGVSGDGSTIKAKADGVLNHYDNVHNHRVSTQP